MGTPQFAVPSLQALLSHDRLFNVVGVVTQPDALAGRGNRVSQSPIKQLASQNRLTVLQPTTLKLPEVVQDLAELKPDVIVVAAFGQILRRAVLDLPPHKCINVHASLLPRWRGASPINAAISAGDAQTGVTIMQMEAGLDSGPILSQRDMIILPSDTTESLTPKLAQLGAELLIETLPRWINGEISPQKQIEMEVTHCRILKKDDGRVNWSKSADEVERHIRAMTAWPSAWTIWQDKILKILKATPALQLTRINYAPGTIFEQQKRILVACGAGVIELNEIQLEGKKVMPASDFARGHTHFVNSCLAG